jgi:hypothetical protein
LEIGLNAVNSIDTVFSSKYGVFVRDMVPLVRRFVLRL